MLRMCLSPVSAGDFGSLPCIYIIPPCSHFPQTRFSSGLDEMEIVVELLSRDSIFWQLSLSLSSLRSINSSIKKMQGIIPCNGHQFIHSSIFFGQQLSLHYGSSGFYTGRFSSVYILTGSMCSFLAFGRWSFFWKEGFFVRPPFDGTR